MAEETAIPYHPTSAIVHLPNDPEGKTKCRPVARGLFQGYHQEFKREKARDPDMKPYAFNQDLFIEALAARKAKREKAGNVPGKCPTCLMTHDLCECPKV